MRPALSPPHCHVLGVTPTLKLPLVSVNPIAKSPLVDCQPAMIPGNTTLEFAASKALPEMVCVAGTNCRLVVTVAPAFKVSIGTVEKSVTKPILKAHGK